MFSSLFELVVSSRSTQARVRAPPLLFGCAPPVSQDVIDMTLQDANADHQRGSSWL
jgi:hypothetical protein